MKKSPSSPQRSLRGRAIQHLARREHSRAELSKKLADFGTAEEIGNTLQELENSGLLSDTRAAEAYVRSHATRFGTARLIYDLRNRGIKPELIDASLHQEGIADELQRARELWQRKFFGVIAKDRQEWARQARFLQSRGFSTEIIRKLLKTPSDTEEFESE